MDYATTNGIYFSDDNDPSLLNVSALEGVKKMTASFVSTLALGKKDSFKSVVYEEYYVHVLKKEKQLLEKELEVLNKKIALIEDVLQFIDCLSLEITEPNISGSAASDLSLEWINESGEELILTFKGNGKIVFSGILDAGTVSGVAFFKNKEIPKNIKPYVSIFDQGI